ncbi:MAG: hypothetical protein KIT22_01005 [Verrucomicrobiae bacterium]|nr:hypothetical protein [Verrucomicrobiae bacterium]
MLASRSKSRWFRWIMTLLGGSLAAVADEAILTITAPQEHQVHQRTDLEGGWVTIRGTVAPQAGNGQVECRLTGGSTASEWETLASLEPGQREFQGRRRVPAGGWYQLEVRLRTPEGVAASVEVARIGMGEVFLVAGQSNAANHGEELLRPDSGRVAAFDGRQWRLAEDPQAGASGNGGSLLPPFGDAMVERFDVPIGLIPVASGGTSVREWLPRGVRFPNPPTVTQRVRPVAPGEWESDGALFEGLAGRLREAGGHGVRAVLWHQGESDANQKDPSRTLPGARYRELLTRVIRDSRQAAGWPVPWFVAQASYHTPEDPGSEDIRSAQRSLWREGLALAGPDTDALTGAYRDQGGQGVHFSGSGLREHGRRWASAVAPWLERELGGTPGPEGFQTRRIEGWTVRISDTLLADQAEATGVALGLLKRQLAEIGRVVPAEAARRLRAVTLWFSPEYPQHAPRAEYHPDVQWLRANGRHPGMAKGVEFTNVRIFEVESRRMPNFALHELAHAYHDQVLGFEQAELVAAFDRARASGRYDAVERVFGDGRPPVRGRAYAMTSVAEYFAEGTEAYFSRNDFEPYTREELLRHDPDLAALLARLWETLGSTGP